VHETGVNTLQSAVFDMQKCMWLQTDMAACDSPPDPTVLMTTPAHMVSSGYYRLMLQLQAVNVRSWRLGIGGRHGHAAVHAANQLAHIAPPLSWEAGMTEEQLRRNLVSLGAASACLGDRHCMPGGPPLHAWGAATACLGDRHCMPADRHCMPGGPHLHAWGAATACLLAWSAGAGAPPRPCAGSVRAVAGTAAPCHAPALAACPCGATLLPRLMSTPARSRLLQSTLSMHGHAHLCAQFLDILASEGSRLCTTCAPKQLLLIIEVAMSGVPQSSEVGAALRWPGQGVPQSSDVGGWGSLWASSSLAVLLGFCFFSGASWH
jgi:hypothetical protein